MAPLLAGILVFFTSAAVLVLEILAARLLAPFVGVTLGTYTAIIGTVLAGISLGSFIGGRLADRVDPRRLLGPTLMLGGILALLTVPIVNTLGPGLLGGGPVATVLLAFTGFFLPATVLSAIPPTVVKLQLSRLDQTGRVVGRLSALGTAGAIAGTFLTGFVLVAAFPSRPVFLGLGIALLLAGAAVSAGLRVRTDLPLASMLVVALGGGVLTTVVDSPCQVESAYFCAQVVDDVAGAGDTNPCEGRTLVLDTLLHACVHLDDPQRLDFSYAQSLSDVLAAIAPEGQPLDALHIGGGGFTLPRYLSATRPGSRNLVLELDPSVVEISERELGLVQGPELRVEVGDARLGLARQPDDAYDVVIGDAFGGLAVPWHLTTRELVEEVERTLRTDGVYAVNLIDFPPLGFARAEVATLRAVFDHVTVVGPSDRLEGLAGGNFVLVASNAPLPLEAIATRNASRGDDDTVAKAADIEAFTAGAHVLTDDYAPVDQLLNTRGR